MLIEERKKSYQILGIDISSYSEEMFLKIIEVRLHNNNPDSAPIFVVTVNPEIIVQSIIDPEFRNILSSSSINTADGVGISWAVNKLYGERVERITGSDSLEKICEICSRNEQSVFFYGAMPNIASEAAEILKRKINNLIVAGTFSPDKPDLLVENLPRRTRKEIQSANAIFVALGAPAQEKWIHANLKFLPSCKLIIGIGGSFDFISGHVKRAPVLFRKSGMEWLYRLFQEPTRWRRMMRLPLFALNILFIKSTFKNREG